MHLQPTSKGFANAWLMRRIYALTTQEDAMKQLKVIRNTDGTGTNQTADEIRLSLVVSTEMNKRLEEMAETGHTSKSDVLRKALALYDVVAEAKSQKNRFGILDKDRKLLTEIVGI